jgi:hypothetical protein
LSKYLNLSFGRSHARAWSLLTARDQTRWGREQYVRQEKANDQVRDQVGALGRARYSIASLKQTRSRASAVVRVSSGLGTSRLRFVLRLEGGEWRIDYGASWSELN